MQSERLTLNCKHGHMTFSCEKMLCRLIVLPVLQHSLTAAYEVVATFVFMYMHLVFSRLKGEKKSTVAQIDRVTWMWEITGVAVVGGMGQIAEIGSRDMRGSRNCEGCRDGRDCKGCNGCRNVLKKITFGVFTDASRHPRLHLWGLAVETQQKNQPIPLLNVETLHLNVFYLFVSFRKKAVDCGFTGR